MLGFPLLILLCVFLNDVRLPFLLCYNLDAHGLCATNDARADTLEGQMAHTIIRLLDLCNLVDLLEVDFADKGVFLANVGCALLDARSTLEEEGGRGRLCDKGEGAVALNGDDDGEWGADLDVLGAVVELFAKVHGLDTALTEGGSDGWGGGCLAGGDDQAEEGGGGGGGFLGHWGFLRYVVVCVSVRGVLSCGYRVVD